MMKKITGIILGIYIICGLASSYFFYEYSTGISGDKLQKKLVQMQINLKSTSEWLDRLPGLFTQFPAASTILILNQKTKLLGSLYEPSRINKNDYNEILKTYKTTELRKYNYTRTLTQSGISIWIISQKNIGLSEFLRFAFTSNSKLILIPVSYFLVLIILVSLLLSDTHTKKPVENLTEMHPEIKMPSPDSSDLPVNDRYLSNKIMLLMDTIEKNFSTQKISFYSRESGKWLHVLEKSGNLVVRGDVAVENIPLEILDLTDQNWREPLISSDRKTLFIPLYYRNNLFGLLRLVFTGLAADLNREFLDRLIALCNHHSHAIFMQKFYDKAVSDSETDFFNYPYFYFIIKEKIISSQNFAVVVFELSDLNRISPEKTRLWALDLVNALTRENLKPAIAARLERARFALLFELKQHSAAAKELNKLNRIPEIIREKTQSSFHGTSRLTGGFFVRPTGLEDADAFMKRLDYLIINSAFSAYAADFEINLTATI